MGKEGNGKGRSADSMRGEKKLCGPCGSDSCNYYPRQDKALPQSNLLCVDVKH